MSMFEILRDIVCSPFRPIGKQGYLTWLKRANHVAAKGRFCETVRKLAKYHPSYFLRVESKETVNSGEGR